MFNSIPDKSSVFNHSRSHTKSEGARRFPKALDHPLRKGNDCGEMRQRTGHLYIPSAVRIGRHKSGWPDRADHKRPPLDRTATDKRMTTEMEDQEVERPVHRSVGGPSVGRGSHRSVGGSSGRSGGPSVGQGVRRTIGSAVGGRNQDRSGVGRRSVEGSVYWSVHPPESVGLVVGRECIGRPVGLGI